MSKYCTIFSLLLITVYCQLDFSSQAYQSQTRQQKMDKLWREIIKDTRKSQFPLGQAKGCIFFQSVRVTFNHTSDIFPQGRQKLLHSVGSVAKAQYIPLVQTPYTGFFKGADNLIIRFSSTTEPVTTNKSPEASKGNFFPGFSLKYLIDGQPSSSLLAMLGSSPISSWNFFKTEISNHVPTPPLSTLKKFSTASTYVQSLGLLHLAQYDQFGNKQQNATYPFKLIFRAPDNLKALFPDQFVQTYIDQIATLPAGTIVYDVFALQTPTSSEVKIGQLKLVTQPTTSKFSDEQLFFQHHDMENDIAQHPEWESASPQFFFCSSRKIEEFEIQCPFSS